MEVIEVAAEPDDPTGALTRASRGYELAPLVLEESLVEHAERELSKAGLLAADSDYDGMLGRAALELVGKFAEQGHSGASAAMTTDLVQRLMRYEPLTPLTSDPGEWQDVSEMSDRPLWQSRRNPKAFSEDGGQTWELLEALISIEEALAWTATQEAQHPRWPSKTPGGLGGKFMRIGQRFMFDGHEWEIDQILDGNVVAHEASGSYSKVETREFDPKTTKGPDVELTGATPAKPRKITGGKASYGGHGGDSDVTVVDPYVDHDSHDPALKLPGNGKVNEEQWKRFGRLEQLHYIDLQQRYGSHTVSGAAALITQAYQDFDSHTQSVVDSAYHSQYGSSSGWSLSLTSLFKGSSKDLAQSVEQRAKARELQARIRDAYAWDLYNRTKQPDVSLFHKDGSHQSAWWKKFISGPQKIFSGLSQSHHFRKSFFGNTTMATPVSIRHIVMATYVAGPLKGAAKSFTGEKEMAIPHQFKVDSRSMSFDNNEISGSYLKWLENTTTTPQGGSHLELFKAAVEKGEYLPIPPPAAEINLGGKGVLPPPKEALDALAEHGEALPEISKDVTAQTLKDTGLPFDHIDDKGLPEALTALDAGYKPGDFMMGMQGTLYWIGPNPNDTSGYGLTIHKLVSDGAGGLKATGSTYPFDGTHTNYKLKGNVPPPKDKEIDFDPEGWVFAAEKATPISTFKPGDRFKVDGNAYEVTGVGNAATTPIRSLDSGVVGVINSDYQSVHLVPKEGWEPETQKLKPAKGFTLAYDGKKHVVTTVKKDGTVSIKPSTGGHVVVLNPDDSALDGLFDQGAWQQGEKITVGTLDTGDYFHGGHGAQHRPYRVDKIDETWVYWTNLDSGESGKSLKKKKVVTLLPTADNTEVHDASPKGPPTQPVTEPIAESTPYEELKKGDAIKLHQLKVGDQLALAAGGQRFQVVGHKDTDAVTDGEVLLQVVSNDGYLIGPQVNIENTMPAYLVAKSVDVSAPKIAEHHGYAIGQEVEIKKVSGATWKATVTGSGVSKTGKDVLHVEASFKPGGPVKAYTVGLDKIATEPNTVGGPVAVEPPAIPHLADEVPFPENTSELKVIKGLGGSTGAKLVEDPQGNKFVYKVGASEGHLREEALSDALYRAFGVAVPASKIYETSEGPVKLSQYLEDAETIAALKHSGESTAVDLARKQLAKNFAVDALLANWDVTGLSDDNVMLADGVAVRIDNGGSLRYRAQGGLKGPAFGEKVGELETLRDAGMNPTAAAAFGGLTDSQIADQVVVRLTPDALAAMEKELADEPELLALMKKRATWLQDWATDHGAEFPEAPVEAPVEPQAPKAPSFDPSTHHDKLTDTLPSAEGGYEAYKSAYGTGGKYKHNRIAEMPAGTVFQDKTGKKWKVQIAGHDPIITDGHENYTIDGQLRGRALPGTPMAGPQPPGAELTPTGKTDYGDPSVIFNKLANGDHVLMTDGTIATVLDNEYIAEDDASGVQVELPDKTTWVLHEDEVMSGNAGMTFGHFAAGASAEDITAIAKAPIPEPLGGMLLQEIADKIAASGATDANTQAALEALSGLGVRGHGPPEDDSAEGFGDLGVDWGTYSGNAKPDEIVTVAQGMGAAGLDTANTDLTMQQITDSLAYSVYSAPAQPQAAKIHKALALLHDEYGLNPGPGSGTGAASGFVKNVQFKGLGELPIGTQFKLASGSIYQIAEHQPTSVTVTLVKAGEDIGGIKATHLAVGENDVWDDPNLSPSTIRLPDIQGPESTPTLVPNSNGATIGELGKGEFFGDGGKTYKVIGATSGIGTQINAQAYTAGTHAEGTHGTIAPTGSPVQFHKDFEPDSIMHPADNADLAPGWDYNSTDVQSLPPGTAFSYGSKEYKVMAGGQISDQATLQMEDIPADMATHVPDTAKLPERVGGYEYNWSGATVKDLPIGTQYTSPGGIGEAEVYEKISLTGIKNLTTGSIFDNAGVTLDGQPEQYKLPSGEPSAPDLPAIPPDSAFTVNGPTPLKDLPRGTIIKTESGSVYHLTSDPTLPGPAHVKILKIDSGLKEVGETVGVSADWKPAAYVLPAGAELPASEPSAAPLPEAAFTDNVDGLTSGMLRPGTQIQSGTGSQYVVTGQKLSEVDPDGATFLKVVKADSPGTLGMEVKVAQSWAPAKIAKLPKAVNQIGETSKGTYFTSVDGTEMKVLLHLKDGHTIIVPTEPGLGTMKKVPAETPLDSPELNPNGEGGMGDELAAPETSEPEAIGELGVDDEFEGAGGHPFKVVAQEKGAAGAYVVQDSVSKQMQKVSPGTAQTDVKVKDFVPPPEEGTEVTDDPGPPEIQNLIDNPASADAIEAPLNGYKSAWGSGGKYKHEWLSDLKPADTFTDKSHTTFLYLRAEAAGKVLVYVPEDGIYMRVKANTRVRKS